jgi:hypothetical protein
LEWQTVGLACLTEGLGIRATARVFEVNANTVLHWLVEAAEQLRAFSTYFHIPPNYVVERFSCSSKAARGEDLQVEHPVWCGYAPAFHFYPHTARQAGRGVDTG